MNTSLYVDKSKYPPSTTASSVAEKSQSNFFRQRAHSQLRQGEDRILLKADDINKNMASMEMKLREMGHVKRVSNNSSLL